mgnify:FL=1
MKKIALKNAARGTAFDYAGQSWILLENDPAGRTLCLSKDITETRAFDEGNCNNFAVASSKEYLNGAYLDNLLEDVNGPNAFLTTELDLTTDDGLKDYGTCTVTIFLLTVDQYRRNRDVIPNADDWWWLSTAFSTKSNGYESLARSVSTDGALYGSNAYCGNYGLRPACNLSSDLLISDSVDSDGCYTVIYNQAPTAPSSITVPSEVLGGENLSISWAASTDPDGNLSGYVLERKVGSGTWAQIYKGSSRSYTDAITYGWTSVQYRVKAYDAAGAESAYTTSATRTVTNNRPPVISGTDGALGSFSTAAPSYEYTVTDADGHQVDVVEMLDGVTLRSYTVTLGHTNTLTIGSEAWLKVVNGSHTLKIVATDAKDASVTRTLTFTKAVTSVEFEQTLAMEADAMPTKALVNIQGNFPAGCTLQVWICNNGNDASPTWEDITQKVRAGQKHYFTNKTKTAAAWGVKVKAKLLRGSATETCYIQSIGGNFA